MPVNPEVIRSRIFGIKARLGDNYNTTIDRQLLMATFEMIGECAVALAEINEQMQRMKVVNWEKLALETNEVLRKRD